ncbi:T9SS type A sorting domain-containing protein [Hymenobacter busanensis]|uniref:T9SS type A sorting domain-containing protein n=1 Tax=Hymenobacter busanensis TaxID=2607656 RepID=UPI001421C93E|nr:T9SS type A sorting domain-containing protein [Hymenobacter busanensis]
MATRAQTLDPTFTLPRLTAVASNGTVVDGIINDVVLLPDGKYLVGGSFQRINGVVANNLARLLPDGTLDATFAGSADAPVYALALQPDGKILVGGAFSALSGQARQSVGRLLAGGSIDVSFTPASQPLPGATAVVSRIALEANGNVLISGRFNVRGAGSSAQQIARLSGTSGQTDAGFQPGIAGNTGITDVLVQPDGKILVSGVTSAYVLGTLLTRFLPDGSVDNSFTTHTTYFISGINDLALDPAGNIYAAGESNTYGLLRYSPSGNVQYSFQAGGQITNVGAVAVQPNGRVLIGAGRLYRMLPDGNADASFAPANGPTSLGYYNVRRLLVQPNGAIVAAGLMTVPGSTATTGMVRLLDANVLHVRPAAADARVAAWPVPAHDELNLELGTASRPQRVQLLDALGRAVYTQHQPAVQQRLTVSGFPAGTYQLQVDYADGSRAQRRVVLH